MRNAAASGPQDADRMLPSISTGLNVEGNELIDIRAPTVARERGDMDEDLVACASGLDEAEAAVVIPLRQSAVSAHDAVRDRSLLAMECGIVYASEAIEPVARRSRGCEWLQRPGRSR